MTKLDKMTLFKRTRTAEGLSKAAGKTLHVTDVILGEGQDRAGAVVPKVTILSEEGDFASIGAAVTDFFSELCSVMEGTSFEPPVAVIVSEAKSKSGNTYVMVEAE